MNNGSVSVDKEKKGGVSEEGTDKTAPGENERDSGEGMARSQLKGRLRNLLVVLQTDHLSLKRKQQQASGSVNACTAETATAAATTA